MKFVPATAMSDVRHLRPKQALTQYNEQLRLPDKTRAIKELVVCNSWDTSTIGPSLGSGPTLITTIPWGIIYVVCAMYKN